MKLIEAQLASLDYPLLQPVVEGVRVEGPCMMAHSCVRSRLILPANFSELRYGEVRRIPLLGTSVNSVGCRR